MQASTSHISRPGRLSIFSVPSFQQKAGPFSWLCLPRGAQTWDEYHSVRTLNSIKELLCSTQQLLDMVMPKRWCYFCLWRSFWIITPCNLMRARQTRWDRVTTSNALPTCAVCSVHRPRARNNHDQGRLWKCHRDSVKWTSRCCARTTLLVSSRL